VSHAADKVRSQVIAALDVDDADRALALVERLAGRIDHFKIGNKLFTRHGPELVEEIAGLGGSVFLDLKFHDIPSVVGAAVAEAAGLEGVFLTTVHASGGRAMIEEAAESTGSKLEVVGVTALTSLDGEDVRRVAGGQDLESWARGLAELADDAGADGIVCSAREAGQMRQLLGPDALLVTPGIRLPGDDSSDQKRVMTPGRALEAGSDYLVMGRSIYGADDPEAAVDRIIENVSDHTNSNA
jgi:orotidine-5'-phosphate decarboxylase